MLVNSKSMCKILLISILCISQITYALPICDSWNPSIMFGETTPTTIEILSVTDVGTVPFVISRKSGTVWLYWDASVNAWKTTVNEDMALLSTDLPEVVTGLARSTGYTFRLVSLNDPLNPCIQSLNYSKATAGSQGVIKLVGDSLTIFQNSHFGHGIFNFDLGDVADDEEPTSPYDPSSTVDDIGTCARPFDNIYSIKYYTKLPSGECMLNLSASGVTIIDTTTWVCSAPCTNWVGDPLQNPLTDTMITALQTFFEGFYRSICFTGIVPNSNRYCMVDSSENLADTLVFILQSTYDYVDNRSIRDMSCPISTFHDVLIEAVNYSFGVIGRDFPLYSSGPMMWGDYSFYILTGMYFSVVAESICGIVNMDVCRTCGKVTQHMFITQSEEGADTFVINTPIENTCDCANRPQYPEICTRVCFIQHKDTTCFNLCDTFTIKNDSIYFVGAGLNKWVSHGDTVVIPTGSGSSGSGDTLPSSSHNHRLWSSYRAEYMNTNGSADRFGADAINLIINANYDYPSENIHVKIAPGLYSSVAVPNIYNSVEIEGTSEIGVHITTIDAVCDTLILFNINVDRVSGCKVVILRNSVVDTLNASSVLMYHSKVDTLTLAGEDGYNYIKGSFVRSIAKGGISCVSSIPPSEIIADTVRLIYLIDVTDTIYDQLFKTSGTSIADIVESIGNHFVSEGKVVVSYAVLYGGYNSNFFLDEHGVRKTSWGTYDPVSYVYVPTVLESGINHNTWLTNTELVSYLEELNTFPNNAIGNHIPSIGQAIRAAHAILYDDYKGGTGYVVNLWNDDYRFDFNCITGGDICVTLPCVSGCVSHQYNIFGGKYLTSLLFDFNTEEFKSDLGLSLHGLNSVFINIVLRNDYSGSGTVLSSMLSQMGEYSTSHGIFDDIYYNHVGRYRSRDIYTDSVVVTSLLDIVSIVTEFIDDVIADTTNISLPTAIGQMKVEESSISSLNSIINTSIDQSSFNYIVPQCTLISTDLSYITNSGMYEGRFDDKRRFINTPKIYILGADNQFTTFASDSFAFTYRDTSLVNIVANNIKITSNINHSIQSPTFTTLRQHNFVSQGVADNAEGNWIFNSDFDCWDGMLSADVGNIVITNPTNWIGGVFGIGVGYNSTSYCGLGITSVPIAVYTALNRAKGVYLPSTAVYQYIQPMSIYQNDTIVVSFVGIKGNKSTILLTPGDFYVPYGGDVVGRLHYYDYDPTAEGQPFTINVGIISNTGGMTSVSMTATVGKRNFVKIPIPSIGTTATQVEDIVAIVLYTGMGGVSARYLPATSYGVDCVQLETGPLVSKYMINPPQPNVYTNVWFVGCDGSIIGIGDTIPNCEGGSSDNINIVICDQILSYHPGSTLVIDDTIFDNCSDCANQVCLPYYYCQSALDSYYYECAVSQPDRNPILIDTTLCFSTCDGDTAPSVFAYTVPGGGATNPTWAVDTVYFHSERITALIIGCCGGGGRTFTPIDPAYAKSIIFTEDDTISSDSTTMYVVWEDDSLTHKPNHISHPIKERFKVNSYFDKSIYYNDHKDSSFVFSVKGAGLSSLLYVLGDSNRVGIGTSQPQYLLDVAGVQQAYQFVADSIKLKYSKYFNTIKSGAISGNLTYVLPTTSGSAGYFLSTDGNGILSWTQIDTSVFSTVIKKTEDTLFTQMYIYGSDTTKRYVGYRDTLKFFNTDTIDARYIYLFSGADSARLYDDGDTTRFTSENPILIPQLVENSKWYYNITNTADTVLNMKSNFGLFRGTCVAYGGVDSTHINLGGICTTGTSGQNYKYINVFGYGNNAGGQFTSITGGYLNKALGSYNFIGAGQTNNIAVGTNSAFVGSGSFNRIAGSSSFSVIAGGDSNYISDSIAVISGGKFNYNAGKMSVISGGLSDTIVSGGTYAAIVGGYLNKITADADYGIIGGAVNYLSGKSSVSFGWYDTVKSDFGAVLSGFQNKISGPATDTGSVIIGGRDNNIDAKFGTILGGRNNKVNNDYSTIIGFGDTVSTDSTVRIAGRLNQVSKGNLHIMKGFKIVISDPTNADSLLIYDDGDTTRFNSDNIIKIKGYEWCRYISSILDSVTTTNADSVVIGWKFGKSSTLFDWR